MSGGSTRDAARQTANVAGAVFQVAVPALFTGADVGRVSDENGTLVVPAGYAFGIWGVIFALCLAYAVYGALPANRTDGLLRRIGWFTAGAFFLNGLWEILFPARQFLLAQAVIVVIFACAAGAYLRFARESSATSRADRWLVAPTLGLLFGWLTAATSVGFATTLVAIGLLDGGVGEALLGAVLLLLAGSVAAAAALYGKSGPSPALYLTYAAAVLWALVAIVLNQYDASILTTGAAIAAAGVVLAVLARRGRRSGRVGGGVARSDPA